MKTQIVKLSDDLVMSPPSLPKNFDMPFCPDCKIELTHSSTGFTPNGTRHACGCEQCRKLFDINNSGFILREIIT